LLRLHQETGYQGRRSPFLLAGLLCIGVNNWFTDGCGGTNHPPAGHVITAAVQWHNQSSATCTNSVCAFWHYFINQPVLYRSALATMQKKITRPKRVKATLVVAKKRKPNKKPRQVVLQQPALSVLTQNAQRAPVSYSRPVSGTSMAISNGDANQGSINVRHREFVTDVPAANASIFSLFINSPINPGNGALFPWLSQIAIRYESYRFKNLRFVY